jgi:membrane protease YdiL (CAAX protease family)
MVSESAGIKALDSKPDAATIATAGAKWVRVVGLAEVLSVLVLGHVAAGPVASLFGVQSLGAALGAAVKAERPDFVGLSGVLLEALLVQYGCLFALAFGIGLWRRRPRRSYGLSLGGRPVLWHVGLGVLAFCVFALPNKVLWMVHYHVTPLGAGPVWWALLEKPWTWSFWLFFAVGSFAFIPLVEELFYRGYCQGRLQEGDEGIGAAVVLALLFTFMHAQYHQLNVLSIGMIITLLPIALATGYLFWRTRSLVAPITLHVLINVPTRGNYDFVVAGTMVAVLAMFRRQWLGLGRDVVRQLANVSAKAWTALVALVAIVVGIGFQWWPWPFTGVAVVGLIAACVIDNRMRRNERASWVD